MLKANTLRSRITIETLIPRFGILLLIRSRWTVCIFFISLLTLLLASKTAWAEDNYYQIINGSVDSVSDGYDRDGGYTIYFNFEGRQFLLDTGYYQSSFFGNLETAGINTDELDYVVLSHNHVDHTSGWKHLRKQRPLLTIYVPPGQTFSYSEKLNKVEDFLKVTPNVFLLHTHDELGSLGIKDELSLLIRTKEGPFFFTSNSHTDFIMKLDKAERILGESVYFHSGHTARRVTSDKEIMEIAKKTKARNVIKVSPSHSRPSHDEIFKKVFGTGFMPAILGKKVPLKPAASE